MAINNDLASRFLIAVRGLYEFAPGRSLSANIVETPTTLGISVGRWR